MDWTAMLTPLVIALIPAVVAAAKPMIPARLKVLYPLLATALGPLGDLALAYFQARAADPKWGVMMGLAAVAVREIIDQLRKMPTGPTIASMVFLVALMGGCSYLPPMKITCKGKGTLSFQGGPYAGMVQGDCGEGFEYQRGAD